jgi:hypothetical protein
VQRFGDLARQTLGYPVHDDEPGRRTGYAAISYDVGLGWRHGLSPRIEPRPEVAGRHSSARAFDLGTRKQAGVFAGDIIARFGSRSATPLSPAQAGRGSTGAAGAPPASITAPARRHKSSR